MRTYLVYAVRTVLALGIISSIGVNWYVYEVQSDYEVLTEPDGPDTSDYFE